MPHVAPRPFTTLGPLGTSHAPSLLARIGARRAFAELKQTFMLAVADLDDPQSGWLQAQVRAAEEPVDLWLLRAPIFEALSGTDPDRRRRRQMLRRSLDSVFVDSQPQPSASAFTAF
jgi:hypothetical protein